MVCYLLCLPRQCRDRPTMRRIEAGTQLLRVERDKLILRRLGAASGICTISTNLGGSVPASCPRGWLCMHDSMRPPPVIQTHPSGPSQLPPRLSGNLRSIDGLGFVWLQEATRPGEVEKQGAPCVFRNVRRPVFRPWVTRRQRCHVLKAQRRSSTWHSPVSKTSDCST